MDQINVIKAGGYKEPFNLEKIKGSIRRAGIPPELESKVVEHVEKALYPDITTREVYRHVKEFLDKSHPATQIRYSLRQSLMDLGPSGYPFEKYIAQVLHSHGYVAETNLILQGKCVTHEVDLVAEKSGRKFMLECKYHNLPGARSDVKVALYVKSRYDDLAQSHNFSEAWIVTNTKCSLDAVKYADCAGLKIVSWGYPPRGNLQELIESAHLYPLTCQTVLSSKQKNHLLSNNIVLCKDLLHLNPQIIQEAKITPAQQDKIKQEVNSILI